MKVVSTEALTKLIQLIKSSFISVDDTEQTSEITLATVALSGDYDDLTNKPTVYHPDLLSFQWSDHLLNNVSWLRADTFSWQDGTVYAAAYEHLTDDITGITPTTETVGSNTITVYTATDGHKIVLADQAQTVQDIYNETGVAWYFILDTTNQRFKLPRTKFGFTGLRDTVGKYVEAGLPNITGTTGSDDFWHDSLTDDSTGPFYREYTYGTNVNGSSGQNFSGILNFDSSRSSSIYGNSSTVQPPATQMYLYFYVGDYTQTAIEQTAGLNAELFNGKLDTSTFDETPHIVETYVNGTSWYQIWSNKWCVQGGQSPLIADYGTATINLLKTYANTNYTITKATMMPSNGDDTSYNDATCIRYATKTTSSFQIYNRGAADGGRYVAWQACGYIS